MPFTVADVDKHNKGLSDKQKKQWVEVANSVLDDGGNDAKAIRMANGVVKKDTDIDVEAEKERIAKGYVPWGITTFDELDDFRAAQEQAYEINTLLDDFIGISLSIANSFGIDNKAELIMQAAEELKTRIGELQIKQRGEEDDLMKGNVDMDNPIDVHYALMEEGFVEP